MIHRELLVEDFLFTCAHCAHAWTVEYHVQHVEDGHGHECDYTATPVPIRRRRGRDLPRGAEHPGGRRGWPRLSPEARRAVGRGDRRGAAAGAAGRSVTPGRSRVQRVDQRLVVVLDHVALDLHRRGDSGLDGQVVVEQQLSVDHGVDCLLWRLPGGDVFDDRFGPTASFVRPPHRPRRPFPPYFLTPLAVPDPVSVERQKGSRHVASSLDRLHHPARPARGARPARRRRGARLGPAHAVPRRHAAHHPGAQLARRHGASTARRCCRASRPASRAHDLRLPGAAARRRTPKVVRREGEPPRATTSPSTRPTTASATPTTSTGSSSSATRSTTRACRCTAWVHYGERLRQRLLGRRPRWSSATASMFDRFTKSLDVIGHELTHGVTENEAGLSTSTSPARSTSRSPTSSARSSSSTSSARPPTRPTG